MHLKFGRVEISMSGTSGLALAFISGSLAATASLFGKLSTDTRTNDWARHLLPYMPVTLIHPSQITLFLRVLFFSAIFITNALMWIMFTKALARSKRSVDVVLVNSAANVILTVSFPLFYSMDADDV